MPWSYISSTDTFRSSGGQIDVDGGIDIPVMPGATLGAGPGPGPKIQVIQNTPAGRTSLAGRKETIHLHEGPSVPLAFVEQLHQELGPPRGGDALGQVWVPDHARHIQVLHADALETPNQVRAEFMEEISPRVHHVGMGPGHLGLCFLAVGSPFLLSAELALPAGEGSELALIVLGVRNAFPRGEDCEILQTQVHANRFRNDRKGDHRRVLQQEAHVPPPRSIPGNGDRRGHGFQRKRSAPTYGKRLLHLRQRKLALLPAESAGGEFGRLPSAASLEPRVSSPLREEGSERSLLVAKTLLEGNAAHFVEKLEFGPLLEVGQMRTGQPVGETTASGFPARFAGAKGLVSDHPHAAKGPVKQMGLLAGGVEAVSECSFHRRK